MGDQPRRPPMPHLASARIARYAPSSVMAAHHHEAPTIGLVVAGSYEERTRGRRTTHGHGHILVCPAYEPHAQAFSAAGALKVLLSPTPEAFDYLAERVPVAEAPYCAGSAQGALAVRIHAELSLNDAFSPLVLEGLMLEVIGGLGRAGREAAGPAWLLAARELIETRIVEGDALDRGALDAVARAVGRHPVSLARAFRRHFGQTLGECARRARVRRAAALLACGRQPIADVALDCGFCDQAHLTRSFKAVMGVTPAAYRAAVH